MSYFRFRIRQVSLYYSSCNFVLLIEFILFTCRPWGRCFPVWYVLHQCFRDQCSEVRNDEGECDEYGGGASRWEGHWYCRKGQTNQVGWESTHVHTLTCSHTPLTDYEIKWSKVSLNVLVYEWLYYLHGHYIWSDSIL